jgi:hypothetical protein
MQLVQLDVSENKLEALPGSLGSCFSLEELVANGIFSHLTFLTQIIHHLSLHDCDCDVIFTSHNFIDSALQSPFVVVAIIS